MLHDRRGNSCESAASSALSIAQIGPTHPAAQHGDLMPEREDLDLLGPVTAPEQDQELKDTAGIRYRTDQNTSSEDARYASMPEP